MSREVVGDIITILTPTSALALSSPPGLCMRVRFINLKRKIVVLFISRNAQFYKILQVYCKQLKCSPALTGFFYDGEQIGNFETPASLLMANDTLIEVFQREDVDKQFTFNL